MPAADPAGRDEPTGAAPSPPVPKAALVTGGLLALIAQVAEFVDDLVEVIGGSFLIEDVSPAADGELLFHVATSRRV